MVEAGFEIEVENDAPVDGLSGASKLDVPSIFDQFCQDSVVIIAFRNSKTGSLLYLKYRMNRSFALYANLRGGPKNPWKDGVECNHNRIGRHF